MKEDDDLLLAVEAELRRAEMVFPRTHQFGQHQHPVGRPIRVDFVKDMALKTDEISSRAIEENGRLGMRILADSQSKLSRWTG